MLLDWLSSLLLRMSWMVYSVFQQLTSVMQLSFGHACSSKYFHLLPNLTPNLLFPQSSMSYSNICSGGLCRRWSAFIHPQVLHLKPRDWPNTTGCVDTLAYVPLFSQSHKKYMKWNNPHLWTGLGIPGGSVVKNLPAVQETWDWNSISTTHSDLLFE